MNRLRDVAHALGLLAVAYLLTRRNGSEAAYIRGRADGWRDILNATK